MTLARIELDDPRWTAFVGSRHDATAFHLPEWTKLLSECYGFRPFALAMLDDEGAPVAGLPVVETTVPLSRRRRWLSLPFTDHCAPLAADDDGAEQFAPALERKRIADGVERLEVRWPISPDGVQQLTTAVLHRLRLEPDDAAVFRRLSKSQAQRNIVRAKRNGVTVRIADRVDDADRTFFDLQLETRRRLGVPVQPRRFYTLLWTRMLEPGHGSLLLAYHENRPIAGALFLRANNYVIYKYGASLQSHWPLRANALVFWTAIEQGCASGAEVLDFGRTELHHEGLRAFKRNWGTEETPLTYTILGRPVKARSQMSHGTIAHVIRRSPPWVCRALGETLYRYAA